MKKLLVLFFLSVAITTSGCSAKTVQDVGSGMVLGAAGGTPLAPFVLGVGIITELVGKSMGDAKSLDPNSIQFEGEKENAFKWMAQGEVLSRFRSQLRATKDTPPEHVKVTARNMCADVDKLVAEKKALKINKKEIRFVKEEFIPEGDGDFFLLLLDKNPFDDDCTIQLEASGNVFVSSAKN